MEIEVYEQVKEASHIISPRAGYMGDLNRTLTRCFELVDEMEKLMDEIESITNNLIMEYKKEGSQDGSILFDNEG